MSNKRKSENIFLLEIIIGVFAVIGFIFFIGQLFENKKESLPREVETKPENSLEKKKKRLSDLERYIAKLSPHRNQLEITERNIYLWSRIAIAIGFIGLNISYLYYSNWLFDLGAHVNLNGAIILVYSFFAFIIYGTPETMARAIREKTGKLLKRKHIHILSELKEFEKEKEHLLIQIRELEIAAPAKFLVTEHHGVKQ